MALRNFWMRGQIDGRATEIKGGPVNKFGGMSLTLYVRDNGASVAAVEIDCIADKDGNLTVEITPRLPTVSVRNSLVIRTER